MRPYYAISLKLLSTVAFITMAALIKVSVREVPPGEAVFFRSLFAIPVIMAWLAHTGQLRCGLRPNSPMAQVWRGVLGTVGMGLGFAALGLLPFSEAKAIGYSGPLLTVVFSAMFLGERPGAYRLASVILGFVGVLVILAPQMVGLDDVAASWRTLVGIAAALGSATAGALSQVFVRELVKTEQTAAIVFWFSVTSCLMALFSMPFGWVVPDLRVAGYLALAGILGGLGQMLLTGAYRFADAAIVAPFGYISMVLAIVIGYFVFGEVPTATMLSGAGLIILAGLVIIWREHRAGINRSEQRKAMTPME